VWYDEPYLRNRISDTDYIAPVQIENKFVLQISMWPSASKLIDKMWSIYGT